MAGIYVTTSPTNEDTKEKLPTPKPTLLPKLIKNTAFRIK